MLRIIHPWSQFFYLEYDTLFHIFMISILRLILPLSPKNNALLFLFSLISEPIRYIFVFLINKIIYLIYYSWFIVLLYISIVSQRRVMLNYFILTSSRNCKNLYNHCETVLIICKSIKIFIKLYKSVIK